MANILLIEPGYKNKYPPLGLMKIAQYHHSKRDAITFIKGEDPSAQTTLFEPKSWDRIYITTLFSFEYQRIARSIDYAISLVAGQRNRIFVGGIAASLMYERFVNEPRWQGIRFIKGLLGEAPSISLKLNRDELHGDDVTGQPIEDLVPDYSILDQIDYKYPVNNAYFTYASRGCIRKCKFCGVPKLEGEQRDTNSLTSVIQGISERYGEKRDLILMDNNVVASPRFKDIIAEIIDLGFEHGSKLSSRQRRVDFNQGVDARILCKNAMFLRELSRIAIKPLRIAFDHWGLSKPYSQAIRYAASYGITNLSNYMLYNFYDTPSDLFNRMHLNVKLNEELNIQIFSFPMRYQPVTRVDRGHIGKSWNRYYLRSMQVILQATHGVVSGNSNYFRFAFGNSTEEFKDILLRPHHFIFNRHWYEKYEGRAEYNAYLQSMSRLSSDEKNELLELLCTYSPTQYSQEFKSLSPGILRDTAYYFVPISKTEERSIWQKTKHYHNNQCLVPEDERVEDAGLTMEI